MQIESYINFAKKFLVEKNANIASILFFASFSIYLIPNLLGSTFVMNELQNVVFYITLFASLLISVKIFILDEYSMLERLLLFLFLFLLFAIGKNSLSYNEFYYTFLILGARDIKLEKILKWFLSIVILCTVIVILLSLFHVIPTLSVGRSNSSTLRLSLGHIYPTNLAAKCFYIALTYVSLKKFRLSISEFISLIAVTLIVYFITDTKLDTLLLIFLIISTFLRKWIFNIFSKLNYVYLSMVSIIFIFINILLAYFFNEGNIIFNKLNSILSGRLFYGHKGFTDFNVTLLGQVVPQNGFGGLRRVSFKDYFFIDVSYVRLILMDGLFIFFISLLFFTALIKKFSKQQAYSLLLAMLFVFLSSAIDQHLWEYAYNIIFISFLTDNSFFKEDILNRQIS